MNFHAHTYSIYSMINYIVFEDLHMGDTVVQSLALPCPNGGKEVGCGVGGVEVIPQSKDNQVRLI